MRSSVTATQRLGRVYVVALSHLGSKQQDLQAPLSVASNINHTFLSSRRLEDSWLSNAVQALGAVKAIISTGQPGMSQS